MAWLSKGISFMRPPRSLPTSARTDERDRLERVIHRVALGCAAAALLIALGALGGWTFDLTLLHTVVPGRPTMQPLTIIAVALLAIATIARLAAPRSVMRWLSLALGTAATVIAVVVVVEYATGWTASIERWLFTAKLPPTLGGRMSPPTAAALLLLGAALVWDDARRSARVGFALAAGASLIALWALAGHLFGGGLVYRVAAHPIIGVAIPTAAALQLLSVATLLTRPQRSPLQIFVLPSLGGLAARRLLAFAIGAPLFTGIVVQLSRIAGLSDVPLALGLLAASSVPLSVWLVIAHGRAIDAADALRIATEERFRAAFEEASDCIFITDERGVCVEASEQARSLFSAELVGRSLGDLVVDSDRSVAESALRATESRAFQAEWSFRVPRGEPIPVEVRARLLSSGSWMLAARDIRDRRAAERNLARVGQAERHAREQLESIVRSTDAVSDAVAALPTSDLPAVLKTITVEAQALTHARYAAIGLVNGDSDEPSPFVFSGMSAATAAALGRTPHLRGVLGLVAREGRVVRVNDVREHPAFVGFPEHHPPMRSFLGVPIRYRGRPVGNLYLADKTDAAAFSEDDEQLASLLATRVGPAIEAARLHHAEAEARAWLQEVVDQLPDGVIITDPRGAITTMNRAALKYTVAPARGTDALGNQMLFDIREPDGTIIPLENLPLVRAVVAHEVTENRELVIRKQDGSDAPILASSTPIWSATGEMLGAVVVFQDVSALKELERMREQWTSIIAHDLRQPLAVISAAAQSIVRRASLDEPTRRTARTIGKSCTKLERMTRDLLDASRIEASSLTLERAPVDVAHLVRGIVERASAVTKGAPIHLDVRDPIAQASVDAGRIEQVLFNLISNAAKYGEHEPDIRVSVSENDGEIEISVRNRGPGIEATEVGNLFARFSRTSSARGREGVGLGLYIVKGLVEAHGGRIWVESTPGEQTTFHFTLPALPPSEWRDLRESHPQRSRSSP